MSYAIDKLPVPSIVRPKKVVGLGASRYVLHIHHAVTFHYCNIETIGQLINGNRTGTTGLTMALRMLGYEPYHVSRSVKAGIDNMKALEEAMTAGGTEKPFTLDRLDRLWGPCDVGGLPVAHYLWFRDRALKID